MMRLVVRHIGARLSGGSDDSSAAPAMLSNDRFNWVDSSLELERGLDVLELSVDVLLPDIKETEPPRGPQGRV